MPSLHPHPAHSAPQHEFLTEHSFDEDYNSRPSENGFDPDNETAYSRATATSSPFSPHHRADSSSPARGYADIYQRINEEEDLAHEESFDAEDERQYGYRNLNGGRSGALTPVFNTAVDPSSVPATASALAQSISARSSEFGSGSGSSSSGFARDLHHLNVALNGQPRVFSKARREGDVGLHRRRLSDEPSYRGSPTPPLNVPRQWGKKARMGREWLAARREAESQIQKSDGNEPKDRRQPFALARQGRQNQSVPSPFLGQVKGEEDEENVHRKNGNGGGATNMASIAMWNPEDDFTGRSLQISDSPPVRIRNATLDRMQEKRGDAKNSATRSSMMSSPIIKPLMPNGNSPNRHLVNSPNGERIANHTPINQFVDLAKEELQPPARSPLRSQFDKDGRKVNGSSQDTNYTHHVLKQLARATSESPHDVKKPLSATQEQEVKRLEDRGRTSQASRTIAQTPIVTGAWVEPKMSDQTPQNVVSRQRTTPKTPFVTGGWIDTPAIAKVQGVESAIETDIRDATAKGTVKTDVSESEQATETLKYSGPPLPRSTLDSIIKTARGQPRPVPRSSSYDSEDEPTLHLGDSTIQSLQDLVANDTDYSTILAPTPPSEGTSPPPSSPEPKRKSESQRLEDMQSNASFIVGLKSLASSVRDTKKCVASLERKLTEPDPFTTPPASTEMPEPIHMVHAQESHLSVTPFLHLSTQSSYATLFIRFPIPRLYTWPSSSSSPSSRYKLPQLTPLGWLILTTMFLVLAEYYAQMTYCHPFYARSMVGYGVDIHAPRPPFVLAKVVWKRSQYWHYAAVPLRIMAWLLGWYDLGSATASSGFSRFSHYSGPVSGDGYEKVLGFGDDVNI